jgi:hypothetical protein
MHEGRDLRPWLVELETLITIVGTSRSYPFPSHQQHLEPGGYVFSLISVCVEKVPHFRRLC